MEAPKSNEIVLADGPAAGKVAPAPPTTYLDVPVQRDGQFVPIRYVWSGEVDGESRQVWRLLVLQ